MKAFSILQPWATLLVSGVDPYRKLHETRSWPTTYRGPIAIHASVGKKFLEMCVEPMFWEAINAAGYFDRDELPRGAVLGIGELIYCKRVQDVPACDTSAADQAFGDWRQFGSEGRTQKQRYAWRIVMKERFKAPVPAKGCLGLWNWEPQQAVIG